MAPVADRFEPGECPRRTAADVLGSSRIGEVHAELSVDAGIGDRECVAEQECAPGEDRLEAVEEPAPRFVEDGVRRWKACERGWSQGFAQSDREAGRRHAEEIGQTSHLTLGEASSQHPRGARRQHARELPREPRTRVVRRRRHHPAVVVHHVEAELVERLVDQARHERDRGIGRNQPAMRRRMLLVDPECERRGVVEHAPVVLDEERHERVLVEIVEVRVARDRARALGALDHPVRAQVLKSSAFGRQPVVAKPRPIAASAKLEREGRQLGAPDGKSRWRSHARTAYHTDRRAAAAMVGESHDARGARRRRR